MATNGGGFGRVEVSPKRVLAYVRVSTVEQAERGTSLASQREKIGDLCKWKNWPKPIFYSDDGVSGAKAERPGLQRLRREMREGDMVVITELDRLEHKNDKLQVKVRAKLFKLEADLPPVNVMFLYKIIDWVGELADRAQKVGSRLQLLIAS